MVNQVLLTNHCLCGSQASGHVNMHCWELVTLHAFKLPKIGLSEALAI
ncbi:hypothetical protein Hanom_Chr11g00986591 [Helianthus anomalus]